MKRSASLRLVLMGSAAFTLSACDESVEVGVFETVEQCQVMGYSESACETAIQTAAREHLQSAPRYATKADCEAEFGRCETPAQAVSDTPPGAGQNSGQNSAESPTPGQVAQNQGGGFGSFFMPMMAGYMIGNMMGNRGAMAQPLYRPVGETARRAGGGFFTGGGTRVAAASGLARMPQSVFTSPRAPATTLARGGFGARANSVSVAS
jgi:uncharacterized protein YgiB involved in biofilm formation